MKKTLSIVLLVIISAAGIGYLLRVWDTEKKVRVVLQEENVKKTEEVQRLKEDIVKLEEVIKEEKEVGTPPPPERLAEVFGNGTAPSSPMEKPGLPETVQKIMPEEVASLRREEAPLPGPPPQPPLDCGALEMKINNFFSYLDSRGASFENGSRAYFQDTMEKLSNRLPIAGETLNPADVLNNAYHFYRALSKKDIRAIKEILDREKDTLEQTMDYFYQHLTRCKDKEQFLPSTEILYEYGHFFLSSMGGRSYLFRLDGKFRVMLLYYSAMIVHEANLQEINRYGLDLRPYLSKLELEIKSTRGLYFPEKYLDMVDEVKRSYRPAPPA